MTTNPTVTVELKINGTWTDVSGWVDVGEGGAAVVITRGRENEQADTQPGTCTFSLTNDDGRFSLDLPSGAYYPYFKRWIEVRVTVEGSRRFTGYVSNVATTLDDDTGLHAHSAITCTDTLGIQAMSPAARSWADELIGALNPIYWWKLNEADASPAAIEASGGPSLIPTMVTGTADPYTQIAFGVDGPASLDSDSMVKVSSTVKESGDALNSAALVSNATLSNLNVSLSPFVAGSATVLAVIYDDDETSATAEGVLWKIVTGSNLITKCYYARTGSYVRNQAVHVYSSDPFYGDAGITVGPAIPTMGRGKALLVAVTLRWGPLDADCTVRIYSPGASVQETRPGASLNNATLWVGGEPNGRASAINIAHVAIIPGGITQATYDALAAKLVGDGTAPVSEWLNRSLSGSGLSATLSLTADRQMQRPTLKGSNPAEIGNTLAKSCGGVYLAARDGTPTWIDPSYCPARVEIPFEHIDPDVSREPDESLSYTDVTVDGAVIASSGGWPKGERDVPGLLPDSSLAKYATWLANTSDVWARGRFSQLPIDLLPLDSATTDAYLALDVRSRILPTGVPPQFPADMVYTVEGSSETVTKDTWQITLNTAPDPRFVLGESLLGSDYRLGWE